MKVILLTDVKNVGQKYQTVEVANGFAANFLFPAKRAELATKSKLKEMEALQKKHADEQKIQHELLLKNFDSLKKVTLTMEAKVNEKGHLFQGIHKDDIVDALARDAHINLNPDMIVLESAIKSAGEHDIVVIVGDKKGSFKLTINPEK